MHIYVDLHGGILAVQLRGLEAKLPHRFHRFLVVIGSQRFLDQDFFGLSIKADDHGKDGRTGKLSAFWDLRVD